MSEQTLPHAEPQDGELKPHGDKLDGAVKPASDHEPKSQQQNPASGGTENKE